MNIKDILRKEDREIQIKTEPRIVMKKITKNIFQYFVIIMSVLTIFVMLIRKYKRRNRRRNRRRQRDEQQMSKELQTIEVPWDWS